jgi:hypothetical protein
MSLEAFVLAAGPWDHIVPPGPSYQWHIMSVRIRKLIGTFALFALVIIWALVAMAVAQFPPIFQNWWVAAIYYVVAGIGWIFPAMPLIRWMAKGTVKPR